MKPLPAPLLLGMALALVGPAGAPGQESPDRAPRSGRNPPAAVPAESGLNQPQPPARFFSDQERWRLLAYLRREAEVDQPWEREADTNGNGQINARELRAYARNLPTPSPEREPNALAAEPEPPPEESEFRMAFRVNSRLEERYDVDRDQVLSNEETVHMMLDRLALARTASGVIAACDLEQFIDQSTDGILDPDEIRFFLSLLGHPVEEDADPAPMAPALEGLPSGDEGAPVDPFPELLAP